MVFLHPCVTSALNLPASLALHDSFNSPNNFIPLRQWAFFIFFYFFGLLKGHNIFASMIHDLSLNYILMKHKHKYFMGCFFHIKAALYKLFTPSLLQTVVALALALGNLNQQYRTAV